MMSELGRMFGKEEESNNIVENLKRKLPEIRNLFERQRVAYFIWNQPYMLAADNTFINYVLAYVGLNNAAQGLDRYPEMHNIKLRELNPEFCFLSSEPFPFKEKHAKELQAILPDSKILIVDGELFSWYGTRLLHLPRYLKELKEKTGV